MTAYAAIANSDIDPESPITTSLMTALRDNPIAITEGSSGAPSIVEAALAAAVTAQLVTNGDSHDHNGGDGGAIPYGGLSLSNNLVAGDIAANAVGASEIASSAVHQAELNTSTETDSTVTGYVTLTNAEYSFLFMLKNSGATRYSYLAPFTYETFYQYGDTYGLIMYLTRTGETAYSRIRYVSASAPYEMDGKPAHAFIPMLLDSNGDPLAIKVAPDPIWMYNGPTRVTADRYGKDGKQYRRKIIMPDEFKTHPGRLATADLNHRIDYKSQWADYLLNPGVEWVEITAAMKNADMDLIPHPYMNNDLTDKTVVMLDPTSDFVAKLAAMYADGEDVNKLLHDGYINIGNIHNGLIGPKGLMIVEADWRNTP